MSLMWNYKRYSWKIKKFIENKAKIKFKYKKYYNKLILSSEDTNDKLYDYILEGKPFVAARIGGTELRNIVSNQPEWKNEKEKKSNYSLLKCLSGFCDEYEDIEKFSRLMENSLPEVDLMGVWFNQMEDVIIDRYCKKDVQLGVLKGLEPWYNAQNPWTRALKGKKVLVIHPFKDSIEGQLAKRELLFPGTDILPECEVVCQKAIQTLYGEEDSRARSWFDGLDYMTNEALKVEFDIALIACGAYGLPLAVSLKKAGKQAIHMGGALQLLFGVRGKRWDNFDVLQKYYSDAWIYPSQLENLSGDRSKCVENGCYW